MDEQQGSPIGSNWLDLKDKVCVVTGAGGGIGSEIARELSAAGAVVGLLDHDEKAAHAVVQDIVQRGGRAVGIGCDVTDTGSVAASAAAIEAELGACHVLVNNAATIYAAALMQVDVAKWNHLMGVNLTGYLLCAQIFGQQMMKRGSGSIVHVSSVSGQYPQAYSGPYSVSKAGVNMLSRLLTVELGEFGIRSNTVSPAMVVTPLSEGIYANEEVRQQREQVVPAGRIGMPRDIAEAVLFLASDRSSYINGQDILLDGGLSQAFLGLIPRPGFEKQDT